MELILFENALREFVFICIEEQDGQEVTRKKELKTSTTASKMELILFENALRQFVFNCIEERGRQKVAQRKELKTRNTAAKPTSCSNHQPAAKTSSGKFQIYLIMVLKAKVCAKISIHEND